MFEDLVSAARLLGEPALNKNHKEILEAARDQLETMFPERIGLYCAGNPVRVDFRERARRSLSRTYIELTMELPVDEVHPTYHKGRQTVGILERIIESFDEHPDYTSSLLVKFANRLVWMRCFLRHLGESENTCLGVAAD